MVADPMREPDPAEAVVDRRRSEAALARVWAAVEGLRHGEVRVIIQDGAIVPIERVEKERLR